MADISGNGDLPENSYAFVDENMYVTNSNDPSANHTDYYEDYFDQDMYERLETIIACLKDDAENSANKYNRSGLDNTTSFCNTTHDTVSCWPTTETGSHASVSCPDEYHGVKINPLGKATKFCYENGTWDEWANYSQCVPHHNHYYNENDLLHNRVVRIIYYVGFSVSTAALLAALFIFLYYKVLRCIRNTIHCHLIVTFILKNMMWILLNIILPELSHADSTAGHQWGCKIIVAIYNYLQVTNFFWMLVEGLYLFSIIVWAFATDKFRIWYFILIGWGTPLLIITTWCIVKATKDNTVHCWLSAGTSNYDYIYIVPNLLALGINTIILGVIVFVLISKLRATQSDRATRKLKAARATLILVPLLGVTYVLFITPFWDHEVAHHIFIYINATLQSHQGLAVAVLYCFMNTEVKNTIKHRFSRWQDERSVATRYTRASVVSATHDAFYEFKRRRRSSSTFTSNGKHLRRNDSERRFSCDTNDNDIPLNTRMRVSPEGSCSGTPNLSESRNGDISGRANHNGSLTGHQHGIGGVNEHYVKSVLNEGIAEHTGVLYEGTHGNSVADTKVHFENSGESGNGQLYSHGYSKLFPNGDISSRV